MDKLNLARTPSEKRLRILEIVIIIAISILIGGISRLETRLYEISSSLARDESFVTSIIFYGIINLNILLVIILSFLVVRNILKLLVERRRGVFGSKLRTKLVATLMVFSLAPTIVIFYASTRFINESFDEWFGSRVRETMQRAQEATSQIYAQDQRRLEGVAKLAAGRIRVMSPPPVANGRVSIIVPIEGLDIEFGVHSLKIYDREANVIWRTGRNEPDQQLSRNSQLVSELLGRFASRPSLISSTVVEPGQEKDTIKAAVPLRWNQSKELAGLILVEEQFEQPFLKSLEQIMAAFGRLKPGAQLVRVSYLIWITVMTLLIIFAAVWFGFRVARAIIGPIQLLAEATKEVALGNYSVTLKPQFDDETGQLMKSFNTMTQDLEKHRKIARDSQFKLELNNGELLTRRQTMEVVLENIGTGVIAVDHLGLITAFNSKARLLLRLQSDGNLIGRKITDVIGNVLTSVFWDEVTSPKKIQTESMTRDIDLRQAGIEIALFVAVTHLKGQVAGEFGYVVVFDDATQRAQQEKILAWKEVASRIAHEIKNPITPIKLSAERLLRRFANRFEGDDYQVFDTCIRSILVQVDSLKNLVNEFGRFTRLPSMKLMMGQLSELVWLSVEVFRQGYVDIDFICEIENDLPLTLFDPDQLNRAVVNLLTNAVDAVEAKSSGSKKIIKTKLTFSRELKIFVLSIQDNGGGIPPSIASKVFDPYVSSKSGGTGLGLAITYQIITEHQGRVFVKETNSNGTIFVVELPLRLGDS